MFFTLNKKVKGARRVLSCLADRVYCASKKEAIRMAYEIYHVPYVFREYGRSLTAFSPGNQGIYWTLTCYGN